MRLREKHGGEVVVCTAGPARVAQVLREALARGADRAIHVEDDVARQRRRHDRVARVLAEAMRGEAFDLILTGLQSDDQGHAQTGVILAARLGMPHATIIMEVKVGRRPPARQARARRRLVPVGGDAAAGGAHDPERHQPAALRDAEGHHGGEEEGDPKGGAAGRAVTPRARRSLSLYVPAEVEADRDRSRVAPAEAAGDARAQAARRRAGDLMHDPRHRRAAGRHAQPRVVGSHRGRAAARRAVADHGRRARAPAAAAPRQELAAADVAEVIAVTSAPRSSSYTADGWVAAHAAVIDVSGAASIVLLPHTYQTRDFAPALAARLDRALITDCTGIKTGGGKPAFTRPMFQGKLAADVRPLGEAPWLVTIQIGAFRADAAKRGGSATLRTHGRSGVDAAAIRQTPEAPFQEAQQAVDLVAGRAHRRGRPRHQGTGDICRSRRPSPRRSAPSWPPRARSATAAGCPWSARSAARARPSRRSSTSRSASPARFSTSSA